MASKTTKMSTIWQKLWNIHSSYFHSCQIIDYCQNCQIRERLIKRLKRCRALEGVRVVFQQVTRAVCQIYVHSKQLKSDLLSLVFTVFYRKIFLSFHFHFHRGYFIITEAAPTGVLWENIFLEISQNTQENTCARVSLLKKRLWHRCFSVNFAKFLRTSFL